MIIFSITFHARKKAIAMQNIQGVPGLHGEVVAEHIHDFKFVLDESLF